MALHRDIYWVGRQWAVTGYGLQLIDQRLKGVFDIEIERLRDQRVLDTMRARNWLKVEDFEKAVAAAHKRFPGPARPRLDPQSKPALPVETLLGLSEAVAPVPETLPPISPSIPQFRTENEIDKADLQSKPASPDKTLLSLSEPVEPVPATMPPLPPSIPQRRSESEIARVDLPNKPALPVETRLGPSQPVAPAPAKLPASTLEFRAESERARADLESKMSALDGLLRSRGFGAPQPTMPPPSILPVQAEGELAKFAPQWRVRN
jgi:hypothetical protein